MAVSNRELEFNFNEDRMRLRIRNLEQELEKIAAPKVRWALDIDPQES